MNRRGFLQSCLALAAAPAIVKAESLMPIWVPKQGILVPDAFARLRVSQTAEEFGRLLTIEQRWLGVGQMVYSLDGEVFHIERNAPMIEPFYPPKHPFTNIITNEFITNEEATKLLNRKVWK